MCKVGLRSMEDPGAGRRVKRGLIEAAGAETELGAGRQPSRGVCWDINSHIGSKYDTRTQSNEYTESQGVITTPRQNNVALSG